MKLFKVIGSVTLSRCHESYRSARLIATESMGMAAIGGPAETSPDLLIVWDELGAGIGSEIAVSDGGEASQPFRPELKPVDAYCSALLDTIHIDQTAVKQINFH